MKKLTLAVADWFIKIDMEELKLAVANLTGVAIFVGLFGYIGYLGFISPWPVGLICIGVVILAFLFLVAFAGFIMAL